MNRQKLDDVNFLQSLGLRAMQLIQPRLSMSNYGHGYILECKVQHVYDVNGNPIYVYIYAINSSLDFLKEIVKEKKLIRCKEIKPDRFFPGFFETDKSIMTYRKEKL